MFMGDLVILTETAFQGAVGKKDGSRAFFTGNGWLFAMMREDTGNDHLSRRCTKPSLSNNTIYPAASGTKLATGCYRLDF